MALAHHATDVVDGVRCELWIEVDLLLSGYEVGSCEIFLALDIEWSDQSLRADHEADAVGYGSLSFGQLVFVQSCCLLF